MRSGFPGITMASVAALVLGACATQAPSMRSEPGKDIFVQVEYVEPERFTDIGETFPGGPKQRDANLDELRRHIEWRAQLVLGDGQRLQVSITDIDLAGKTEPWHLRMPDTRIVRDIYPPRIDLRFTLTDAGGAVLRSGERHLRDFMFMASGRGYSDDRLRYEKALLDDWIAREFGGSRSRFFACSSWSRRISSRRYSLVLPYDHRQLARSFVECPQRSISFRASLASRP